MSTLREAAQQALEALELYLEETNSNVQRKAITALRAALPCTYKCEAWPECACDALAQEEQQPVAWMYEGIRHDGTAHGPHLVWKPEYMDAMSANKGAKAAPLYTQPSRREWQSLTNTDISRVFRAVYGGVRFGPSEKEFAIAIEAALKEKNA